MLTAPTSSSSAPRQISMPLHSTHGRARSEKQQATVRIMAQAVLTSAVGRELRSARHDARWAESCTVQACRAVPTGAHLSIGLPTAPQSSSLPASACGAKPIWRRKSVAVPLLRVAAEAAAPPGSRAEHLQAVTAGAHAQLASTVALCAGRNARPNTNFIRTQYVEHPPHNNLTAWRHRRR